MKNCIVIGGGIIGLCSAYYLQKEGHQVTIIDQSNMDEGASYINAGYLSPSHIIPLSAPGVMKKGLKWMFDAASPLYIKPRFNWDFLKWVWAFNRSCNASHVYKSIPVIKDITVMSQDLYVDISLDEKFSAHYEKKGILMLCNTEKMLEEEIATARLAKEAGLNVKVLDMESLKKTEPNVVLNAVGAVHYKCDFHATPNEFMQEMKASLQSSGVKILKNEAVRDLIFYNGKIKGLETGNRVLKADEYVLAAGSWTAVMSKKIGLNLLLQAGKGYSMNVERPTGITMPAILSESKVAATPMNGFTRFGGTMEIAGINKTINKARVNAISKAVSSYYPDIQVNTNEINKASCGLRPLSFDGLPYIGKSEKCQNLTIATGHAMMGWSMATATGKLVSEIISNKKTSLNLEPFSVDRK